MLNLWRRNYHQYWLAQKTASSIHRLFESDCLIGIGVDKNLHAFSVVAIIGKQLGRKALEAVATIVEPDTILRWHAKMVAQKFDGSDHRRYPG